MPIRRGRRIAAERIREGVERLLDASRLCAIATVSGSRAHVNTAYFAWDARFRLVWLSEPRADHSKNLEANRSVAIAVFDSNQTWGTADRGLQLFGSARAASAKTVDRARETYAQRFPDYDADEMTAYRTYEFRPRRVKLFDETEFGTGVFVTARVADGAVSWLRTDVYSPRA